METSILAGHQEYFNPSLNLTLRKAVHEIGELISVNPSCSFPRISGTRVNYNRILRTLSWDGLTPEGVLGGHYRETIGRCGSRPALCIHDTTEIIFGTKRRGDLGYVNAKSFGFLAHVSMLLSADGQRTPLGIMSVETLNRPKQPPKKKRTRAEVRVDPARESERWWRAFQRAEGRLETKGQLIHIADAEADNYALLSRSVAAGYRFVIRVGQDRRVKSEIPEIEFLFDLRPSTHPIVERTIEISERLAPKAPGNKAARSQRVARLALGVHEVTVPRPKLQDKSLSEQLNLTVVRVWEVDTPEGEVPIEWMLVTTESVQSQADIERIVDWYRARWMIEELFKGLKTTCKIEERQLESYQALANATAFFLPSVWHMLLLRHTERNSPDKSAGEVLSPVEIKVLQTMPPRKLKPNATAQDAMLLIAAWGGHLPQNGPPGWQTLYGGYKRMRDAADGWEAAMADIGKPMNP